MWAALVAGVATLAGVVLGALLTGYQSRRHWHREKVLDAAEEFIAISGSIYDLNRSGMSDPATEDTRRNLFVSLARSRARLHLIGSQEVRQRMEDLVVLATHVQDAGHDHEDVIRALGGFTAEARRQCGIRPIGNGSGLIVGVAKAP